MNQLTDQEVSYLRHPTLVKRIPTADRQAQVCTVNKAPGRLIVKVVHCFLVFCSFHYIFIPLCSPFQNISLIQFHYFLAFILPEFFNDQLFTEACKGVIQRCLFLLLYVRTAFPLDQDTLSFIANTNSVLVDPDSHSVDSTMEDAALHIHIDDTANSTPATLSPVLSPLNSPRSEV